MKIIGSVDRGQHPARSGPICSAVSSLLAGLDKVLYHLSSFIKKIILCHRNKFSLKSHLAQAWLPVS